MTRLFCVLIFFTMLVGVASGKPGPVFSVSYSPKANESTFKRNDDATSKTYVGNKFKGTGGYNFGYMSLLGNYVYNDSEYKSDNTQTRVDSNYGLTVRINPFKYFFLQSTYWITNTKLSYSNRAQEKFSGEKLTAGAGIRIPTPTGPYLTISGNYILSSKMKKKGAGETNIVDEEGYSISVGGTLAYKY